MSKMSQLAAELDEQAAELGYADYLSAVADGYEVDYDEGKLIKSKPEEAKQEKATQGTDDVLNELEKAHVDYLVERQTVLQELYVLHAELLNQKPEVYQRYGMPIKHAIDFIQRGEI